MRIFIETYGCAANQSHSEKLARCLEDYSFADSERDADAIILNTCIVKRPTEQKILDRIKSIRKRFPEKKIILAGCLPKIPEILKKADYDGIISEAGKADGELEKLFDVQKIKEYETNSSHNAKIKNNPLIHIEEISEGCLGSCTYCIVKRAKGALKSEPAGLIAERVRDAVKDECKEIWLTAQDTACYGFDSGSSLPELIDSVCRIDSDFFIRIGMMNPEHALKILPELINSCKNGKVYKFLHLPVQSGSNNILEMMGRRYKAKEFLKVIEEFRKALPQIQIRTDIIVGFPGETEDDFKKTIELMRKAKPDFANVSQFGPRPGTPAEKMEQVSGEAKKERSRMLSEILKQIYLDNNKKWIGWEGKVLVTGKSKTGFLGKNFAYKPVQIKPDKNILGETVNVKITRASSSALFGEIIAN